MERKTGVRLRKLIDAGESRRYVADLLNVGRVTLLSGVGVSVASA